MTEATLRAWTRGELPPAERRAVSRWIVSCTDPRLGPLLHGLAIEAAEERADAALAARGGLWSRLAGAWQALLDAGLAQLTAGAEPPLLLAALSDEADGPTLRLEERDGAPVIVLRRPSGLTSAPVALYLTDDAGGVHVLATTGDGPELHAELPTPTGPRATIWAVIGRGSAAPEPALALAAALDDGAVTMLALRIRER